MFRGLKCNESWRKNLRLIPKFNMATLATISQVYWYYEIELVFLITAIQKSVFRYIFESFGLTCLKNINLLEISILDLTLYSAASRAVCSIKLAI